LTPFLVAEVELTCMVDKNTQVDQEM